jgi:hypothetical protein
MKVTIVALVRWALLLHVSSVGAFRQSSTGQFNTLPGMFPKSISMHGYLNSLGKTATAFTPRYEADYPRRHPTPPEPFASTEQQSDHVSQHSSNKAPPGTGFGTGFGGWQRQSTSPSEQLGNPTVATNVAQPEIIKPTEIPSVPEVSWEKPMTKTKSFTGYLDSFARMWSTVDISTPVAAEMVTPEEYAEDVPAESEIVEDDDVPAESEIVEDDDLPAWVKAAMTKDDKSMDKDVFAEKTASRHEPVTENPGAAKTGDTKVAKNVWRTSSPIIVHGNSLRTWSEPYVERVQLSMKTAGRAMFANVELWHGPDTTPLKITIHSDDGSLHPFNAVIETPEGPNTIAVRNTGQIEFPLAACVETDVENVAKRLSDMGTLKAIQGGGSLSYPFDRSVASVQILLMTSGRPLNARIELSQGRDNDKQAIDIYSEDGLLRPFFAVIETPGIDNVVRVVNTATSDFSMTACVQPYLIESGSDESSSQGWDSGGIRDPRWGGRY